MGAWEELDTEIIAETDFDDLDTLLDLDDPYNVFEDLTDIVKDLKNKFDEGTKNGVKSLANFNRSQQQRYLQNCKNPSGRLSTSINDEKKTPFNFIIGTSIKEIYPLCVELGRGEVHPHPPRTRLRFYGEGGYLIYPLMSAPAKPVPFVAPAYEDTIKKVEEIMVREIGHAGVEWD